uniref:Uncharacterized protein n=1 Tax=Anguilla anguilla TaxID=7936 RepID=A0A0E9Q2J3_ANGAN
MWTLFTGPVCLRGPVGAPVRFAPNEGYLPSVQTGTPHSKQL